MTPEDRRRADAERWSEALAGGSLAREFHLSRTGANRPVLAYWTRIRRAEQLARYIGDTAASRIGLEAHA